MILVTAGVPLSAFDIDIETEEPPNAVATNQPLALPRTTVAVDYDFAPTFRWPGLPRLISLHCETQIRQYR